jgi:hypothetical protein
VLRRAKTDLIVLFGYVVVSCVYFGWDLLPHPGRAVVGSGSDIAIYVWSFAWWAHAIGSWTNPLFTHALYAPTGLNVVWTLTVPGLALVFSPITLLFGPVVSYNLAALLVPAVSAWTAFVLCRYLTRSIWASVIGGYLFGFSTAMLRQQLFGHLPVTAVFLLPLVALVVVRYVRAELDARGLAWRLGVLLALQLWLSTEFALTATLMLAVGLMFAFWLVPADRRRLVSSLRPIVAAYGLGAIFAAPIVVYALSGFVPQSFIDLQSTGSDLLNFVVPTPALGVGGSSFPSIAAHFVASGASAYLGLPTLLIAGLFVVRAWRTPRARFLLAALVTPALIALGTVLRVDGHRVMPLPWSLATHLPVINNALPFRFTAYVSLAAAVIVAVWIATTKGRIFTRPYVLPLLAVVALVPAVWRSEYPSFHASQPERLSFFTEGLYKTCIPRNETLAIFPFGPGGVSLLSQAETGFWFRLAEDGLQAPNQALNSFDAERIVYELNYMADRGRPTMDRLLAFAATHHVDRVISVVGDGYPTPAQMRSFGSTQLLGGVIVSPACGQPPLTQRDLASYVKADPDEVIGSAPNVGVCQGLTYSELPEGLYPVGLLAGARRAIYVAGQGVTCASPPPGYTRHGFATPDMSVPADTYPLYSK